MLAVDSSQTAVLFQKKDDDLISQDLPTIEEYKPLARINSTEFTPIDIIPHTPLDATPLESATQYLPDLTDNTRYRGQTPLDTPQIIETPPLEPSTSPSTISLQSEQSISNLAIPSQDEAKFHKVSRIIYFGISTTTLFLAFSIFQVFIF